LIERHAQRSAALLLTSTATFVHLVLDTTMIAQQLMAVLLLVVLTLTLLPTDHVVRDQTGRISNFVSG
jgi:hypothetical protein